MTNFARPLKYIAPALLCFAVGASVSLRASATATVGTDPVAVGYVDAAFLVQLHPAMAEVEAVRGRAAEELSAVESQLSRLDAKARQGTSLSAEEEELFQALLTTRGELLERYQAEIDAAVEPAFRALETAVTDVAERFSVSFIFDINAGRESGFVVYADPAIDLTSVVAEAMALD